MILLRNKMLLLRNKMVLLRNKMLLLHNKMVLLRNKTPLLRSKMVLLRNKMPLLRNKMILFQRKTLLLRTRSSRGCLFDKRIPNKPKNEVYREGNRANLLPGGLDGAARVYDAPALTVDIVIGQAFGGLDEDTFYAGWRE